MTEIAELKANYSPPNVNYWGDRCCKAEAEIERLRAALKKIADLDIPPGYLGHSHFAREALGHNKQ